MNGIAVVTLFILSIIFLPLLTLWSLNVVFGVPAVYDMNHWFGVLALGLIIRGNFKFRGK